MQKNDPWLSRWSFGVGTRKRNRYSDHSAVSLEPNQPRKPIAGCRVGLGSDALVSRRPDFDQSAAGISRFEGNLEESGVTFIYQAEKYFESFATKIVLQTFGWMEGF